VVGRIRFALERFDSPRHRSHVAQLLSLGIMRALKYIGIFFGGFICAVLLVWFLVLPKEDQAQFDYGFTNGVIRGHLEAVDAIQKEFGTYDDHLPYKTLFSAYTSDVVSIETNGVKTVRVIP
jgi:hypothetical protein